VRELCPHAYGVLKQPPKFGEKIRGRFGAITSPCREALAPFSFFVRRHFTRLLELMTCETVFNHFIKITDRTW